jgi:N-acetylglucosamine-6-phosphate deacetylase
MRIHARHYRTGEVIEVLCEKGLIQSISSPAGQAADVQAGWIAPALFDLQINGCGGNNFSSESLTVAKVRQIVDRCRGHGIGALCPTLVTNSFVALAHGLAVVREACAGDPEIDRALPAIHLEGPYIAPEDGPRGAHPRRHVRPPDWDEFCRLQDYAAGRIRLLTLAPERDGALLFIERLTRAGVVVALGHTAATGPRIRDAIAAGARLSTHLGNGCAALLDRHDNVIWHQLAADQLWASMIADGHHLPPAVLGCILRVKTPARTILTCDASSLAGLPPGVYQEMDQEIEVLADGKIVVPNTRYLAGSGAFTDICIATVLCQTQVPLSEAIDMAGARPRELLGLKPLRLQAGDPADLILFDWNNGGSFCITRTVVAGRA